MKNFIFLFLFFYACQSTTAPTIDTWAAFTKCADNTCVKEAIAVKDAFLNDPKGLLTAFQATYEKGEDHVIGWLLLLRDSVLINPKMGTIEGRLTMQKAIIAAAKTYENDSKLKEMAKDVMDYLNVVDVKAGKINDPMAGEHDVTATAFCYQFKEEGETVTCHFDVGDNGDFTGYYIWGIQGKDGTEGILTGKNFKKETFSCVHKYYHEGIFSTETLVFSKKGDVLTQLVSEVLDKNGKMVMTNPKDWKAGYTLKKVDCAKIDADFQTIRDMEAEMAFKYPYPEIMSPQAEKMEANLQGEWQSVTDAKTSIQFQEGKYWDIQAGQKMEPSLHYCYFPVCPKDCNPVAKMPCLIIIGQDDICYAIVKADGKSLEISQIGGTGNTNRYVKKK